MFLSGTVCAGMHSFCFGVRAVCVVYSCLLGLTSEDWAELGPAGDPSFRGVLAQRDLQEEHGQASPEQEDGVRDEKCTWVMDTGNSSE